MSKSFNKSGDTSVRHVEVQTRLMDNDGNILFDIAKLTEILEKKQNIIKEFCYIVHDKDTYKETNEDHKEGDLKPAHLHLMLQFKNNQPQRCKYIAKWFGLEENYLQYIKSWKGACLYLVHFYAKDKYQYDPSEVTSNFDYNALVEKARKEEAEKSAPVIPVLDIIVSKIMNGEIREYNKTLQIDNRTLIKYAKQIETAFKYRSEYLQVTQKERHTEIIFITGMAQSGKTTLAKKIAREKNLDFFISSGSNDILDNYLMEPCCILDDIRPSCMGLSDLLKMLDPNTASSVKSRYKNKYLNAELVILTTVLDIDTFYKNVFKEDDEPITQLKRRCSTYIKMDKNEICISIWDKARMRYTDPICYKNHILDEYVSKEPVTDEEISDHIEKLMPFLGHEEESCGFILKEVPKKKKLKEKRSQKATTYISDKNFDAIMPKKENKKENP